VASLEEQANDRGYWYTARGDRGAAISVHRDKEYARAPFTMFWHGRTDFDRIEQFLTPYFLKGSAQAVNALIFTSRKRFQFDALRAPRSLRHLLPRDTRFLRVECLWRIPEGRFIPRLIVWARLDLATVPSDVPAPDDIGVFLNPDQLSSIADPLIPFIQQTHLPQVPEGDVADCVQALSDHLRPAPDHRPTYA
jgi:hypothetical protein